MLAKIFLLGEVNNIQKNYLTYLDFYFFSLLNYTILKHKKLPALS